MNRSITSFSAAQVLSLSSGHRIAMTPSRSLCHISNPSEVHGTDSQNALRPPLKICCPFRKANSPCSPLNQQHQFQTRVHSLVRFDRSICHSKLWATCYNTVSKRPSISPLQYVGGCLVTRGLLSPSIRKFCHNAPFCLSGRILHMEIKLELRSDGR